MNPATQAWMPAVLSLFGTLIVVVFTAWLNSRMLSAQIDALRAEMRGEISALRAEMRQGFAELRLEFHTQISELSHRVERLEERPGLVQRP
jgi:DNA-binding GntR family transcriptional regulator